jgi:hypothetical protein
MAIQVFYSHTQKDVEFCDIFDRACARVPIKAFRSEFEKIDLPAWQTIRNEIRASQVLFLVVGKELVKAQMSGDPSWAYTQNWISYEIGVACEREMDVWVICDDVKINFPVPYLSNYLPVSLRHREVFDFFVGILKVYIWTKKLEFPDKKYGFWCPNPDCQIPFNLWIPAEPNDKIVCPHCLQQAVFNEKFPVE